MKALYRDVFLKTRVFWLGFLVSVALAACAVAPTPTPTPTQPPPTPAPTPGAPGIPHTRIPFLTFGTWQTDVTYCQDGDVALKMDVLYPDATVGAAAPVVIFLHTLAGTKDEVEVTATEELLKRGYVVVAPNWRRPPDAKLPVAIGDAKCAIRHLRANAGTYHIDPNRIGAWGCSFGGSFAALLGLTNADAGLEGSSGFSDQSSRVKAVVARDLDVFSRLEWKLPTDLQQYFGVSSVDDPAFAKASPLIYVSKDSPPFLILHSDMMGTGDTQLYDKLKAVGAPATFVEITGSDHCAGIGNPSQGERAKMIADFFDKNLK
jgi:acetyl esterase/lipase